MLGAFVTFLFCAGAAGLGIAVFDRWLRPLDPACRLAFGGLIGLGSVGTLTLLLGLLPSGLRWGLFVVAALGLGGIVLLTKRATELKATKPEGYEWAFVAGIGLAAVFGLIGALAPSDSLDWDTLAYHLAVPKIWIHDGSIHPISFIHHSNFPLDVDGLYIWGLQWGGQAGAKAFSTAFLLLGALAVFGMARERYGKWAGWWAALAFATMPVVMWEAGTAYIDVGNGLYVGLGILCLANWASDESASSHWPILGGVMLGFAAGSKYNGLQIVVAACAAVVLIRRSSGGFRGALTAGLLALAIASPWYVKNVLWTGNPVYPFFFERFGGKNWNQTSADMYRDEQQSFGVGRTERGHDPAAIGEAVLGLAFQPGRYNNPGQTSGLGFPFQALGFAVVAGGLVWCFSGRMRRYEAATIGSIGIAMLMWFFLSQQSRYLIGLAVPLCALLGGAVVRLRAGPVVAAAAAAQGLYSAWLIKTFRTDVQLPVLAGKVTEDQFLSSTPFHEAAKTIDEVCKNGRVALYNEVFGFFLDVPYFWANPGHSTEIPYATLRDGHELALSLKSLGMTHVYLSLDYMEPGQRRRMIAAMGLGSAPHPYTSEEIRGAFADIRNKWPVLLAQAIESGDLAPIKTFGEQGVHGILFSLR